MNTCKNFIWGIQCSTCNSKKQQRKWEKKFKEKPGISYIQKYNYSLSLIVDTNLLLKQCWDITIHMERHTK